MSEQQDNKPKRIFKLSDDVIVMLRDLIQYSLLLDTNLIDNFRALRLEQVSSLPSIQKITDSEGKEYEIATLVPASEYVEAYNAMVEKLEADLQKMEEKDLTKVASDSEV